MGPGISGLILAEAKAAGGYRGPALYQEEGDFEHKRCEMRYEHSRQRAIVFLLLIVENQYGCFLFSFQGHKSLLLQPGEVHRVVNEMSAVIERCKQN